MRGVAGIDRVLILGVDESLGLRLLRASVELAEGVWNRSGHGSGRHPYLQVEPKCAMRWSRRLGEVREFKVGLVWAGNPMHPGDKYRSMPLATMAPLGRISGVRFYSLQKGAREEEANVPPPGSILENLGPDLVDLSETAAAIRELDLVICVDTAVAHLAGALGKPVWLMIARSCDWRWLEGRNDSPWYPTARLFSADSTRRVGGRH